LNASHSRKGKKEAKGTRRPRWLAPTHMGEGKKLLKLLEEVGGEGKGLGKDNLTKRKRGQKRDRPSEKKTQVRVHRN